jgi:hypothetical protein
VPGRTAREPLHPLAFLQQAVDLAHLLQCHFRPAFLRQDAFYLCPYRLHPLGMRREAIHCLREALNDEGARYETRYDDGHQNDTYHRRRVNCSEVDGKQTSAQCCGRTFVALSCVHEPLQKVVLCGGRDYYCRTGQLWPRLTGFSSQPSPYFSIHLYRSSMIGPTYL